MRPKLLILLLFPMLVPLLLLSQEETQDAEGCHDPAVLTRMPGCTIFECESKEFDAAELLALGAACRGGSRVAGQERDR